FYLHRLDIIDARSWRAILASGQHVIHRRRVAMEKRPYRTVTRVHDPAGDVPPFRLALDPGTKRNPLYAAANDGLDSLPGAHAADLPMPVRKWPPSGHRSCPRDRIIK